jgi:hypothetical protein
LSPYVAGLIFSFDDFGTLLVQKLVTAIGAEELDLLVPELLPMTIEFALALRTGHPEDFGHDSSSEHYIAPRRQARKENRLVISTEERNLS